MFFDWHPNSALLCWLSDKLYNHSTRRILVHTKSTVFRQLFRTVIWIPRSQTTKSWDIFKFGCPVLRSPLHVTEKPECLVPDICFLTLIEDSVFIQARIAQLVAYRLGPGRSWVQIPARARIFQWKEVTGMFEFEYKYDAKQVPLNIM